MPMKQLFIIYLSYELSHLTYCYNGLTEINTLASWLAKHIDDQIIFKKLGGLKERNFGSEELGSDRKKGVCKYKEKAAFLKGVVQISTSGCNGQYRLGLFIQWS